MCVVCIVKPKYFVDNYLYYLFLSNILDISTFEYVFAIKTGYMMAKKRYLQFCTKFCVVRVYTLKLKYLLATIELMIFKL